MEAWWRSLEEVVEVEAPSHFQEGEGEAGHLEGAGAEAWRRLLELEACWSLDLEVVEVCQGQGLEVAEGWPQEGVAEAGGRAWAGAGPRTEATPRAAAAGTEEAATAADTAAAAAVATAGTVVGVVARRGAAACRAGPPSSCEGSLHLPPDPCLAATFCPTVLILTSYLFTSYATLLCD